MYTEETASPGLWKSEILALLGIWLVVAAFILPPGPNAVYNNWLIGAVGTWVAIALSGNRRWERPVAMAAAIWLFISGFVPSVLRGQALTVNETAVGVVLLVAAVSAHLHLRDDIREHRELTM
jgi:hypothetical protein